MYVHRLKKRKRKTAEYTDVTAKIKRLKLGTVACIRLCNLLLARKRDLALKQSGTHTPPPCTTFHTVKLAITPTYYRVESYCCVLRPKLLKDSGWVEENC